MKRPSIFVALAILFSFDASGQSPFQFRRSIDGVQQPGWYSLTLPHDIFSQLNDDLGDLRIYNVNAGDTVENPYLLKVNDNVFTTEDVQLKLLNRSFSLGSLYLMCELNPGQKVNFLDLSFFENNFFAWVTLEGSDDRQQWFTIIKDQRIVSVSKPGVDYRLSRISFPLTDYRYLRLAVRADVPLTFQTASFQYNNVKPGEFHNIPLTWKNHLDKKGRHSFVDIRLEHYVPVSSLDVIADNSDDYYRPLRIEVVADSFRTDKGWIRSYETLYEGHLTSFRPNKFSFPWQLGRDIRMVISDFDNAPLNIKALSVSGPKTSIIAYLKPGTNFMLHGADAVGAPAYDLAYFENKIPDSVAIAHLQPAETLMASGDKIKPLLQSQWWLWSVMLLTIGGLGLFTVKMMRQKPQAKTQ